ncbi:hypothetical protein HZS61_009026 [Fusarium oxysporum f. sp. conglutinans]|uniref:ATP-dependent DNA helicase n=1 Tax=Fusarium oxysporum f. sp. conglutinans TaxID=100902 RepID=A0A8H6GYH0_FUSOX|nr:hypothetical protein HZS61_009026 [Fusarium oxysporum f. sp. conglutinans]
MDYKDCKLEEHFDDMEIELIHQVDNAKHHLETTASAFWQAYLQRNFPRPWLVLCEQGPDGSLRRVDMKVIYYNSHGRNFSPVLLVEVKRKKGSMHEVEEQGLDAALKAINSQNLTGMEERELQPLHGSIEKASWEYLHVKQQAGVLNLEETIRLIKGEMPMRQAGVVPSQHIELENILRAEASHIQEGYSVEQAGSARDDQGNEAPCYPSTTYYEQPSEQTDAQWSDPMDVEARAESSGEDDEPSQAEDSKGKKPRKERTIVNLQQSAIERPVMERRDFELPDPDWMRDLSHCPLSDRDKELLEKFWTELENDRMEHCARCQETWFDMGLKGGICKRCIARDKNKKEDEPWFFSAENQLDFGLIPAFLPQLTIVEEMLIARVHVFVNVMQVRGQQYKYRGHIVHFLRDVGKVYSQLPLLPPELDVILLRPPTASEHAHLNRQFRRQFRVRRRCLQEWLNFLSNNHPGYRGITVCQKRMSVLPEDGDVLDQVATAAVTDPLSANLGNIENDDVEPDEVDQSAVPDLLPEDTEMEALRSHVLGEERGEHLPVRPSTQHQLEMPDIRRTPINEFNHSQALLSLAFPTLFPRGQADFVEPRLRPIKYADYIQHALRWHDGRFARHPTFRFVVFNTLMRAQARAKSSYFVKEYQQRQGLITRDDLLEAFQNPESAEAQQLLNSINRQTAQLRGTRPYWYRKRRELESYAYNLDCPGAFITFSPADLHWRSLYQHLPQFQDWQELPEQQRMGMSSKLLRDNPHIAAWHFYRRFGLFRDIVLKQKFNVTDYWNRYEWQGRGSSHCHGLFWMDGAPSVDLENEHLRKEFARIWRFHVTAFNPEPARVRQQGEGNPLAVNPLQHPLTFQWLSQVLNRCQRHHCSETYCLRKKKGSEEISCRFFFPRDTRDTADVVRRQGQSYFSFEAARNDSLMNHYNRCLSLGWLANIDISPCTSLQAVINYAAKYCSKMEKRTDSYASMGRQILPYVSHQNPLLSFASRLMNKLLTERDFSGQEICHVLLNCELQEGTRVIRAVDCRPYEQQGRSLRLQGDHDDAEVVGIYEKYLSRPPLHEELTYLDFLANWNTSKRDGRKWTRWSRQAKPRVLYYFPRYKSNHQHHQYDDFCRVKLMLAHPHRDPNELRKINGVEYNSYASAAEFCYGNHRHPDDYYGTPNAEERRPDPDEFEEEFHEPDLLEEDWLELARQLPDCPPSQEAIDLLGRRDIDIQYDWTPHVGRYADPGIVQGDYWRQRIEQNRLYMDVEDMPLEVRDALNPEQRIVYDTFIGHFQCGSEEQILLHVDGGGGTGKSYMIKVLSSHLQRLAGNRPSPIWRAAPTGVASNQIMGTTLHSLLRLPMDRAFTELSPADANAIQKKLRDVRYLVIDEKSMLGLRQLSWIDKRLRQVFPARAAEFFGGISIILVGDFFQLPPIANKPLYFDGPLKDLHEVSGQTAYRAFNHTVFLKKVQRQQGDDQAGFRLALEELRGLKLSIESWKLLSQRVQVKLSQREEDTFDAALRIYSKKARVNEYNYEHLVRLKHPAIQVMAKNIGNGADKATSEQAGNLAGQFPPAGLVNGAQGTVYDIGWAPGADAHRDPPSVIMMVMDKYTGPSYLTTDDGREVVPILPVKRDFFLGTSACTRKQFPLMASYAITVHKSQSITVDKMVTDLSERDFQTGLSYVAVSRVKMLDGLMIDAPFERASLHYEKLPDGKHSVLMKVRDQDRLRPDGKESKQFKYRSDAEINDSIGLIWCNACPIPCVHQRDQAVGCHRVCRNILTPSPLAEFLQTAAYSCEPTFNQERERRMWLLKTIESRLKLFGTLAGELRREIAQYLLQDDAARTNILGLTCKKPFQSSFTVRAPFRGNYVTYEGEVYFRSLINEPQRTDDWLAPLAVYVAEDHRGVKRLIWSRGSWSSIPMASYYVICHVATVATSIAHEL